MWASLTEEIFRTAYVEENLALLQPETGGPGLEGGPRQLPGALPEGQGAEVKDAGEPHRGNVPDGLLGGQPCLAAAGDWRSRPRRRRKRCSFRGPRQLPGALPEGQGAGVRDAGEPHRGDVPDGLRGGQRCLAAAGDWRSRPRRRPSAITGRAARRARRWGVICGRASPRRCPRRPPRRTTLPYSCQRLAVSASKEALGNYRARCPKGKALGFEMRASLTDEMFRTAYADFGALNEASEDFAAKTGAVVRTSRRSHALL
mmetsp:Transcript_52215/g.168144  ORF Transcript_52215/g.168144 Transcript_52215/m.168144 type:complete len:259 (-) Transcript_52215:26-802(-)